MRTTSSCAARPRLPAHSRRTAMPMRCASWARRTAASPASRAQPHSATHCAPSRSCSSSSARSSAGRISTRWSPSDCHCRTQASPASPTTPTRAAQPTWACCPICCPAIGHVTAPGPFAEEFPNLPQTPGKDLIEMFDAAERGELGALYVVGANPVARYNIDPASLKNTFVDRAGDVPHRDGTARRRHPARRQSL